MGLGSEANCLIDLFIHVLLPYAFAVSSMFVDIHVLCLVHARMFTYQYVINTVFAIIIIYSWIKSIRKLPIYPKNIKPRGGSG